MPRIFLHIGAHKTGTTSIQHFLASNREFLQQHGLVYPNVCWYGAAQHRLAFAAKGAIDPDVGDRPQFEVELAALRDFLSTCDSNVILSSEVLFELPLPNLQRLHSGLAGLKDWEVQIIASIRRQDNLFASIYNQQTKNSWNKQRRPIAFYLNNPTSLSRDLDLLGCLNNWAGQFGRENIKTYCFEKGDAVSVFLETLGLPVPDNAKSARHLNVGVPAKALELARLVKTLTEDRVLQAVVLDAARKVFDGTSNRLLGTADRSRILKRFAADNEKLFAEYLGSENLYGEKFWSVEFKQNGLEPTEQLNRRDVALVLIAMAESFSQSEAPNKHLDAGDDDGDQRDQL